MHHRLAWTSPALRYFILVITLAVISARPATAGPIIWLFDGTIGSSTMSGVAAGDTASLLLTFEAAAIDSDTTSTCGLYSNLIYSAEAHFGSRQFTYAPASPGGALEVNVGGGGICGNMPSSISGLTFRTFGPFAETSAPATLNAFFEVGPVASDSVPGVPPNFADFLNAGFVISEFGSAVASLTSVTAVSAVPVPEPATLLLVGGGALALAGRRMLLNARSRRQRVGSASPVV